MFSIIKKYKRNLNNICKIREKGVSLISLIVIIIVLLILAGVTIKISSGDSGLIKKTKKGVAMYQNASVNESETLNEYARKLKTFVEVPKATTIKFTADIVGWTTKDVTITATSDDPDYEIEIKSEDSDWSVRKGNKITVSKNQQINARLKNLVDKYSEDVATYNVTNIDKDAPDKSAPALKATTNSITVTFKQKDDGSGIAKREYSIDSGATWKAGDSVFTFSGLTQGKKYAIITRATDRVENQSISDVSYITTENIPAPVTGSNLEFTPTPSGWTNGDVSVAVSTTEKGYTLQTSTDGKTWSTTNPLTYTANGTAYARLWDGNNASAVATTNITNIDKLAPTNTAPTVSTTTNRITATLKQADQNAGSGSGKSDLNGSKTQYRLVTDTNGTTAVTGKDWQSSNVFSGLTQNTTYYVQTKVTDNAGNTTTSAVATAKTTSVPTPTTGANVIFTPSTSGWTNGNVNVTVSTTITGFTLQTSTDGKAWGTTNPLTYSANGTAYARLWDGNNASAVATTNITNIDKLAPTNTAPTVATTTNKITVTLKQVDQNAAEGSGKSDLNASKTQYRLVTDTNGTTAVTGKDWQSSNVFSGLTQNTTYYVQTKVTDNAGNTTTSAVATAKTAIVPSGTTSGVITLTPDHNTWTNTDVKVTATTNQTGYTIQMSTDGKTFTDGTSKTLTSNGTVYARLRDSSNNYGASATISISIIDKLAPTNTVPTVSTTTNRITITNKQVDQNAANGSGKSDLNASKTQYRLVTDTNGTTAVTGKDWQSSNVFSGLTQNTTYYVQTKVTDNAGNTTTSAVATAKTTIVPSGTTSGVITLTPDHNTWTNTDVKVTATTNQTGYTIQMSTDGKTFTDGTSKTLTSNGTVYARLRDSSNNYGASATISISIIDKLAPTNTAPTVSTTTNRITITNKQVDQNAANGSGKSDLNESKTQYRLVTDTNGTTAVTGKDWQSSNVFSGLTQNTTYYVQTKVTDNAGNTTTSAVATAKTAIVPSGTTSGVITLTPDHNTWTNTDVKVTATTNQTGYTIQMSTDGKTFTDGTSKTLTSNGTVYARLRDSSNNYGASATISISIIDKLAPTNTAPTVATTTNKITITNKQVDQNAANGSGKSDLNASKTQYRLVTDTNGTTAVTGKDWQSSNVFSGLTQNTTYYVQTKVTDNAGNTTTSAVSTAKTGTIGSVGTASASPTTLTSGDVTVTLPTLSGFTTKYTIDGTAPSTGSTTYSKPFTVSSNCTVKFVYTDGTNINNAGTLNINNIDKTAYTITYNLNGGTISGQPTTYKVDTENITLPTPTRTGYTFNGWTGSNGTTAQTSVTITKGSRGNKTYTANWTINKYYVDLNATLDGSGVGSGLPIYADVYINGTLVSQNVDDFYQQVDYGTKLEFKNIRAKNGYTLKSEASWSTIVTGYVSYSPVVQTIPKVGTANASPTSWTNGNVTITLPTSTGFTTKYTTNGTAPSASSTTYSNPFTVSSNCTVKFVYTDGKNTNNAGTLSVTNIDKTAPTKPTYKAFFDDGKTTYTSGTWTNKHVKTDISSTDANSGINRIEYSFDKNSWNKFQFELSNGLHQNGTTYTGTESWGLNNRNDTVYFRAIDNAGNISEVFDSFNIRYDVTAPTTTAPTATTKTNSITVTNKQTDNGSGIASIQYQIKKNGTSTWGALQSGATFGGLTQNTKYDVRTHAVDKAGNASDSAVTTVTTDTIPTPVRGSNVTFTATPTTKTSGNVTVKVSTTVTGYTLQTSTNGSTWGTTNPLTFTANGTAYARLWDGNNASAVATFNITNIDKTNYSISYNLNGGSASGNPTSYKVDSSTITINDPTLEGCKFLGWTGSNDLSSGLGNYTSSSPYVAASRDHILGNEFNVTAGEKYRVFVRGTRTKGNLDLQGGIWYTSQTSGAAYDGYGGSFTEIETGLFYKEITIPTGKTKGKFYIQLDQDTSGGSTSWRLYDMHVIKVENPTIQNGSQGNKSYTANWKLSIDANTPVGTKIGTTANIDGQTLNWYLFDVSDDGKTAYLVSTPTYWVPDTTKEVRGAWAPKLVSAYNDNTNAMRQAIQKLSNGTNSYNQLSVSYNPSPNTLSYYKNVNSQWSAQRGSTAFASLNENEQSACYLADADIFAGIKDQVNNAEGNLKGKIQTLVGGASIEQWCKAYNKQSAAKDHKITCEYRATSVPGYIYKVNGNTSTVSNSEYWTGDKTIVGNDIYGAAYTYNRSDNSTYPFSSCYWWLASPSSSFSRLVCGVNGNDSYLGSYYSDFYAARFSLLASVAL